jgi:hypothetical protein
VSAISTRTLCRSTATTGRCRGPAPPRAPRRFTTTSGSSRQARNSAGLAPDRVRRGRGVGFAGGSERNQLHRRATPAKSVLPAPALRLSRSSAPFLSGHSAGPSRINQLCIAANQRQPLERDVARARAVAVRLTTPAGSALPFTRTARALRRSRRSYSAIEYPAVTIDRSSSALAMGGRQIDRITWPYNPTVEGPDIAGENGCSERRYNPVQTGVADLAGASSMRSSSARTFGAPAVRINCRRRVDVGARARPPRSAWWRSRPFTRPWAPRQPRLDRRTLDQGVRSFEMDECDRDGTVTRKSLRLPERARGGDSNAASRAASWPRHQGRFPHVPQVRGAGGMRPSEFPARTRQDFRRFRAHHDFAGNGQYQGRQGRLMLGRLGSGASWDAPLEERAVRCARKSSAIDFRTGDFDVLLRHQHSPHQDGSAAARVAWPSPSNPEQGVAARAWGCRRSRTQRDALETASIASVICSAPSRALGESFWQFVKPEMSRKLPFPRVQRRLADPSAGCCCGSRRNGFTRSIPLSAPPRGGQPAPTARERAVSVKRARASGWKAACCGAGSETRIHAAIDDKPRRRSYVRCRSVARPESPGAGPGAVGLRAGARSR